MNANAQRWHKFETNLIDGKMTAIVPGGYSGQEDYDVKIIDDEITSDKFTKEVFYSRDKGKSWRKTYIMNYSRRN